MMVVLDGDTAVVGVVCLLFRLLPIGRTVATGIVCILDVELFAKGIVSVADTDATVRNGATTDTSCGLGVVLTDAAYKGPGFIVTEGLPFSSEGAAEIFTALLVNTLMDAFERFPSEVKREGNVNALDIFCFPVVAGPNK